MGFVVGLKYKRVRPCNSASRNKKKSFDDLVLQKCWTIIARSLVRYTQTSMKVKKYSQNLVMKHKNLSIIIRKKKISMRNIKLKTIT